MRKKGLINLGQQQLLLLVLGVIIVGIAIVVAINVLGNAWVEANKDNMYSDLMNIGSLAQQYYATLKQVGGGGQSFVGFQIPSTLLSTSNGTYTQSNETESQITFTGKGNVQDSDGKVYLIVVVVTNNNLTTTSISKVSP